MSAPWMHNTRSTWSEAKLRKDDAADVNKKRSVGIFANDCSVNHGNGFVGPFLPLDFGSTSDVLSALSPTGSSVGKICEKGARFDPDFCLLQ